MPQRAALARALLLVLLLPIPLLAQRAAGVAVTGTVVDQTGAVLPNAQVELRSGAGAVLQSTTAGQTGDFQFSNVPAVGVTSLTLRAPVIQRIKTNQDPSAPGFRQPGRGRIEIIPKPASQKYSGTGSFVFRDSALDATNAFAVTKPPTQRRIAEGFLGGPVRHSPDTGFTLSLRNDQEDTQSIIVAQDPSGLVRANVANPYRRGLVSG